MKSCKWICAGLIILMMAVTVAADDDGLKADLSTAVTDYFQLETQHTKIEFRRIRLDAKQGDYDSLAIKPITEGRNFGRIVLEASLFNKGELLESGQVSVNIVKFETVLIANDRIGRNALLSPEQIITESRDVTYLVDKPLTDMNEIVGRRTRRLIGKGNILTYANTEIIPTVEVGKEVKIIYRSGALEISAVGTALENGYTGESIRVRNEQSKKTVEATINNEQTVLITP